MNEQKFINNPMNTNTSAGKAGLDAQGDWSVLVVEDDGSLRNLIVKTLRQEGFSANGVSCGNDAIDSVVNNHRQVLLLDQRLPDMTGSKIINHLKEIKLTPPFIFITGQGDERLAVEVMKLGAYDYLVKGLDLLDLLPGTLRRLLHNLEMEEKLQAAEDALYRNEEKFRFLIENIDDVIWLLDENLKTEYVSPSVARVLGYTPEEWSQKLINDKVTPSSFEMLLSALKEDLRMNGNAREINDRFFSGEIEYLHKDGSIVWMDCRIRVIRDEAGTINNFYGVARDITEQKKAREKITHMNYHDRLTDLYNRYYIEEKMSKYEDSSYFPISVVMADLNGLKLVNDTFGHEKGDEMLIGMVNILKGICKSKDVLARWGGDEFVIIMPCTSTEEADAVIKEVSSQCVNSKLGRHSVSVSLGYACKDNHSVSLVNVIREAEDDMYKQKLTESRSTKNAVLQALLNILAEKSYETEAHTRRMQAMAREIGIRVDLADKELNRLNLLITLHDIGKINISEEILTKRDSLTADEWEQIKRHPEIGYRIAKATEEFEHVAEEILAHHEKWDGTGYPRGLKKEEIPLLARITAIADAYEVMSNGRPYKKAMSSEEIMKEFIRCSGTHFDPALIAITRTLLGR